MSRREGVMVFLIGIVAVMLSGCLEPDRRSIYAFKWGDGTLVPIEEVMNGVRPKESVGGGSVTVVHTPDICGFRFRHDGKVFTTYFHKNDPYSTGRDYEKCLLLRQGDMLTVAPLIWTKDGVETRRELRWRINEEVNGVLK